MRRDILFSLVNGPEGDPAVYANFKYIRRALLFDLGDVHTLSARSLLKVSHIFISHTHVDHFIGFDQMLRLHLGRGKTLTLFGPPGFTDNIEAKLKGYSWNLVHNYPYDFRLDVFEVGEGALQAAQYSCQNCFSRNPLAPLKDLDKNPYVLDEPGFQVQATLLEHDIPCLAYALEEKQHINVDKVRLEGMGLCVGPWVHRAKEAVRLGEPDHRQIEALSSEGEGGKVKKIPLGELRSRIMRFSRGRKIAYVTDAAFNRENRKRIIQLASGADLFFCEAVFSEKDRVRAEQRRHLTAGQAGQLAREAQVGRLVLFHFSPKYHSRIDSLYEEAREAFGKEVE